MEFYNKLVRDKIPEIIAKQGKSVSFRALQGDELKQALKHKLFEEVNELFNAETKEQMIEELADVSQVLYAVQDTFGITDEELDASSVKKYGEKGGFGNGYFLEYVSDNLKKNLED